METQLAIARLRRTAADGAPRGAVLTDSAYATPALRAGPVASSGSPNAVGVRPADGVWRLDCRGRGIDDESVAIKDVGLRLVP